MLLRLAFSLANPIHSVWQAYTVSRFSWCSLPHWLTPYLIIFFVPATEGVGGSLAGQMPYGVLVFGSYEMYKKQLRQRYPETNQGLIFAAASLLGDLTGSLWLCPSEVIKQKIQAGIYTSEREAFNSIWKTTGFLGLYEGYLGGVARDVPFRVAQLVSFSMGMSLYSTQHT